MIKKLDCKQRRLSVNKKDEIQTKNKMLQTKTEKVANKIDHIVQNKLLQTKKVLQTKRRCKLKTFLRYKLKKTSLWSNVHMWCCKQKSSTVNKIGSAN